MDQIQGGAFLTAIDTLKGTGAITEVEGTKATAAKNRMATATSEKAFNDAAKKTAEGLNKVYDDVKKYGSDETEKIMGGKNEYAKAVVTILDKFVEYAGKIEKVNLDLVDNKKTETLKEITEPTLTKINPATSTNVLKDISVGSGISEQQLEKILNVESKTNNFSGEMTLKLDVNAPPGMDVKQLEIMLKDPKVREAVINTIHAAKTNDGAKGYMGRK